MSITSYKCPNCGADIPFDATSGTLKCAHCDTEFELENLKNYNLEKEVKNDVANWHIQEGQTIAIDGKISYVCPTCGGEVVGDENMAATSCPYCGSAIVINQQLSGILKPELIIPFKLTKDDAKKAYENHIKGKALLPDDFKVNNIINKLNGIYVPYWLFDAKANGQARFKTSKSFVYQEGDFMVNKTSYFLVYRDGGADFKKVPVDASSKINDALLDSIEPFDYSQAKEFDSAYLAQYLADKYDVEADQAMQKANERIKNSINDLLTRSVVGYDMIMPMSMGVQIDNGVGKYALLPVYLFTTKYDGKVYQFAMNGQTGKFVGDLPMDKGKALKYVFLIFIITFVLAFAFFNLGGI